MFSIPLYPLSKNRYALIDDEDKSLVMHYKWWVGSQGRAYTSVRVDGKAKNMSMHRFIMVPPPDMSVDHINGNPLDNRRTNLRIVTHAQNLQNRQGATRVSSSGVRNVYYHPGKKKYQVKLEVGQRTISCGYYWTIDEAAIAAAAARRCHMTHAPECGTENERMD